jgi:hypothetical protein
MFFALALLAIWFIFLALAIFCKAFKWSGSEPNYFMVPAVILTGIVIFSCAISTSCYKNLNAKDIAAYRQIDNLIAQRESAMEKNLPEIRKILVDLYPQHERDIFKFVSARDANWLWERYPEMRAAETMQNYVRQLNEYTTWWQSQREIQLGLVANIEARKNTSWAVTSFVPTINRRVVLEKE